MRRRAFLRWLAGLAVVPFLPLLKYHTGGIMKGPVHLMGGCLSSHPHIQYSTGPSEWAHSHCIVYPNGKLRLIPITGSLTS